MKEPSICILGNGGAAIEAIKALRENGNEEEIVLISDAVWPSYNPMLTTYYVSGKIEFSGMFPFGYGKKIYDQYRVNLQLGSPVVDLDADKKVIKVASGKEYRYSKCLIATGARPFLPPVKGIDSKKIYTMRTLEDALKLRDALTKKPKKVLVVGASMVGIKVVELLDDLNIDVCFADMADCIFPLAAHRQCAEIIQKKIEERSIELKLGAAFEGIDETSDGIRAYFKDSEPVEADFAVVCIGVRPNLDFVNRDQIMVDRGIVVDKHMMTNKKDVYAAGDVSQGGNLLTGENQIIGLWSNARYQGRNMAGLEDKFEGNTLHNISHFMDMTFAGIGDLNSGDRHEIIQSHESYLQLAWKDEKLVGVNMIGDTCSNVGIIKNALEKSLINKDHLDSSSICSKNMRNRLLIKNLLKIH